MHLVRIVLYAAATLAGGCSLAPVYQRPDVAAPTAFKETVPLGNWKIAEPSDAVARGEWWTIFGDAQMDALQADAAAASQTLKAAWARLQQARAVAGVAAAERAPQVGLSAGATRLRSAETAPQTQWQAQAAASYEIDLFGRVANAVAAARADAQQAEALYRSLLLALHADVAANYFALRSLDAEIALLERSVRLREEALDLLQRRLRAGEIGEFDVARARTELSVTRAEAIAVGRRRAELEHALAVLTGKPPASFALAARPLVFEPIAVPAGLPSALLERRPDIAAAERALAAANARIGVARAAFFPRITLTGALGVQSAELGDLLQWSSRTWLLGPLAALPLIDGGRNRSLRAQAEARYEEAVAEYRQRVLVALQEVEDSLSALRLLAEQAREQERAIESARRALAISDARFRAGDVNYLDVIDAQRSVLATERGATQVHAERALATVALIRALGGGWQ
jgi:multidrug efflux system outer membrane protein